MISAAKLKRLKTLCAQREKHSKQLAAVNKDIAAIRRELDAALKVAGVPSGMVATARVIPCAGNPKRTAKKKTAKKKRGRKLPPPRLG